MRDLRSGLLFFALSLFVMWESLRLGLGTLAQPGSGFLSFCAGVPMFFFSLVLIIRSRAIRETLESHSPKVIVALVSLFVYSLVFRKLGFIVATFLLVGLLFRLGQKRSWWALLGMSALVTLLSYLIFGVVLHVYFPKGLLRI